MQDDHVQFAGESNMIAAAWQPVSIDAAVPYLKAIALVVMLLAT